MCLCSYFVSLHLEPFLIGFVETTYSVGESVGAVSVCVNLTRPQFDIPAVNIMFIVQNHLLPSRMFLVFYALSLIIATLL